MISAIIVAAGSSQRMGFDKLSADLCGLPVLAHSFAAFEACSKVCEIIVVTSPGRFDLVDQYRTEKVTRVVEGGNERHHSVWNGICATCTESGLIAVHDGARPLVTPEMIGRCAEVAREQGSASLAHRVVDTLKRAQPGGTIVQESVCRDDLWAMETPQIFQRDILYSAYQRTITTGDSVTDEVSAVQQSGHEVHLVENPHINLKITVPGDLELAKSLHSSNQC